MYRLQIRRFQKPRIIELILYLLSCALAYPFLYLITLAARGQTLFMVRLLVGLGCTAVATVRSKVFRIRWYVRAQPCSYTTNLLIFSGVVDNNSAEPRYVPQRDDI
jgi:hypothetical protein